MSNVLKIWDDVNQQWTTLPAMQGADGAPGSQGPAGLGLPEGGTTGQVLVKASAIDHDTTWAGQWSALSSLLLDYCHPIDSLYWSANSTDPGTLFGGQWTRVKDKFILAAGDTYTAGATGGEATHTLTVSEMPSHNHGKKTLTGSTPVRNAGANGANGIVGTGSGIINSSGHYTSEWGGPVQLMSGNNNYPKTLVVDASHTHDSNGGGEAHNNMPPYEVYYCWKRIA